MASDRKKPTPKRRPRPKVAGYGSTTPATSNQADETPTTDTPTTETPTTETPTTSEPVSLVKAQDSTAQDSTAQDSSKSGTDPAGWPRSRPVSRVSTLRPGSRPVPASSVPVSSGRGAPERRGAGGRPAGSGRRDPRGPLATWTPVLAITAVILGVVATVLAFHPFADLDDNKAFVERQATSELTSQAQERVCAIFGYDHTDLDGWQERAHDALTGQARAEFDESLAANREIIMQTKTGADCRVDAIGVRDLTGGGDGDRASVIANLIVSETQNGIATNSAAPRAQFAMVREGDQWRVEAVEPF